MTHPNSLKNLTPWKPGQSGNKSGRPKDLPITRRYTQILEAPLPDKIRRKLGLQKGQTIGDAIAFAVAIMSLTDHNAAREIREAIEGKSLQRLRLEGHDGGPLIPEDDADVEELKKRVAALTESIRNRRRKSK